MLSVHPGQRGNRVLEHLAISHFFDPELKGDYGLGGQSLALFLSLKYHQLYPHYLVKIWDNLLLYRYSCAWWILYALASKTQDHHHQPIKDLTLLCTRHKMTLILCWSEEDVAKYLETFKTFENKPPDLIKEKVQDLYFDKLTDTITQIKSVNKTDTITLASHFGSFKNIVHASPEALAACAGLGSQKIKRLRDAFTMPFVIQ